MIDELEQLKFLLVETRAQLAVLSSEVVRLSHRVSVLEANDGGSRRRVQYDNDY
jgi:hypothetical protein